MSPDVSSPEPSTKKENQRKSKAETKKDPAAKKSQPDTKPKGNSMTSLNDLPSLGGKKQPPPQVEEESNGFGDFDFDQDHIGDSSNKLDDAEKRLQDFYKEDAEGFRV